MWDGLRNDYPRVPAWTAQNLNHQIYAKCVWLHVSTSKTETSRNTHHLTANHIISYNPCLQKIHRTNQIVLQVWWEPLRVGFPGNDSRTQFSFTCKSDAIGGNRQEGQQHPHGWHGAAAKRLSVVDMFVFWSCKFVLHCFHANLLESDMVLCIAVNVQTYLEVHLSTVRIHLEVIPTAVSTVQVGIIPRLHVGKTSVFCFPLHCQGVPYRCKGFGT